MFDTQLPPSRLPVVLLSLGSVVFLVSGACAGGIAFKLVLDDENALRPLVLGSALLLLAALLLRRLANSFKVLFALVLLMGGICASLFGATVAVIGEVTAGGVMLGTGVLLALAGFIVQLRAHDLPAAALTVAAVLFLMTSACFGLTGTVLSSVEFLAGAAVLLTVGIFVARRAFKAVEEQTHG